MSRSRRAFVSIAGSFALAALFAAAPASADEDPTDACVTTHLAGQRDRAAHRLTAARESLLVCSQASCPALVRRDCTTWLREVDEATPTIVVVARGPDGAVVTASHALVDGRPFATSLDGTALAIDPGSHQLRVEADGFRTSTRAIVVVEGQKSQRVAVELVPMAEHEHEDERARQGDRPAHSSAFPVVPTALGVVGLVGFGLFAGFGLAGRGIRGDLVASRCDGHCDQARADRMWTSFVVADVSLVVALCASAAAVLVYAVGRPSTTAASTR